jgi:hypothetical protein
VIYLTRFHRSNSNKDGFAQWGTWINQNTDELRSVGLAANAQGVFAAIRYASTPFFAANTNKQTGYAYTVAGKNGVAIGIQFFIIRLC